MDDEFRRLCPSLGNSPSSGATAVSPAELPEQFHAGQVPKEFP